MSKSISPEIKEYIRECVKSAVKEEVAAVRKELVEKLKFIKTQLEEETTNKIKNSNDKQLQLITRDTTKQLDTYIKKEVMPKLNAFSNEMRERTLDGGQVVTEYRKRVMAGANGIEPTMQLKLESAYTPSKNGIFDSGNNPHSKNGIFESANAPNKNNQTQQNQKNRLSEFQKNLFVFTEND